MDPNLNLRMNQHEALIMKSPAQQRANQQLLTATKNNMIQPNQFFAGINSPPDDTESETTESRANSIDFGHHAH